MNQQYTLTAPIDKFIHSIEYVQKFDAFVNQKVFPTPYITLILSLGNPLKLYKDGSLKDLKTFNKTFISGIQSEFLLLQNTNPVEQIVITFKPYGLNQFVNLGLSKVTNKVADINRAAPDITELIEKLKTVNVDSKLKLVEEYLLKHFKNTQGEYFIVNKVIVAIEDNPEVNINTIAKPLNISKERLNQLFKKYTDVTIANFAYMYKINRVINALIKNESSDWAVLAKVDNDYEKNLFSRRFFQHTGFTPDNFVDIVQIKKLDPTNFVKFKHN